MNETPVPIPQSENLSAANPFDDSSSQRSPASASGPMGTPGTPSSQAGPLMGNFPQGQQPQMGGQPQNIMSPPPQQMMNDMNSPGGPPAGPPGQFNRFGQPGQGHPGAPPGQMGQQGHPGQFPGQHPGMNGPGPNYGQMNGQPGWQQVSSLKLSNFKYSIDMEPTTIRANRLQINFSRLKYYQHYVQTLLSKSSAGF